MRCDALVLADTGNVELGVPTVTTSLRGTGSVLVTVRTMDRPAHSGMYGGAAPDALQALLMALASLRDETGETTIDGLDARRHLGRGAALDAGALPRRRRAARGGRAPHGTGASVADLLWARPAATVLAIDCPPVSQVTAVVQGSARAVVNLRVPAGVDAAERPAAATEHLVRHTPFGAQVDVRPVSLGQPFEARTDGPAYRALAAPCGRPSAATWSPPAREGRSRWPPRWPRSCPEAEILLAGRRGAGLPHPRAQRERPPRRAAAHGPRPGPADGRSRRPAGGRSPHDRAMGLAVPRPP